MLEASWFSWHNALGWKAAPAALLSLFVEEEDADDDDEAEAEADKGDGSGEAKVEGLLLFATATPFGTKPGILYDVVLHVSKSSAL